MVCQVCTSPAERPRRPALNRPVSGSTDEMKPPLDALSTRASGMPSRSAARAATISGSPASFSTVVIRVVERACRVIGVRSG